MAYIDGSIIFLIVFLALISAGIAIIFTFKVDNVQRFQLVVTFLGALSVLIWSYNTYNNLQSNDRIEDNRMAYNTLQNIANNYLMPQKEIVDKYPEGYFLYASMTQDTDLSNAEPYEYDPVKRQQIEVYYSLRIFQTMEDFLTVARYDRTGLYVWLNNFLMWMQSSILRHYWNILSFNYSDDTREMVGRIIQKSDDLIALRKQKGHLTNKDYDAIAKVFFVKPR